MSKKHVGVLFLLGAMSLGGLGAGCDDDDHDKPAAAAVAAEETAGDEQVATAMDDAAVAEPPPPASTAIQRAEATGVNLTGEWQRTGLPSIYRFNHTGESLQGIYYEPDDPQVHGDIAGTVNDPYVELDVVVTYADGIRTNFVAHKTGKIMGEDRLRLVVTHSPHAQGQVQDWYRQSVAHHH